MGNTLGRGLIGWLINQTIIEYSLHSFIVHAISSSLRLLTQAMQIQHTYQCLIFLGASILCVNHLVNVYCSAFSVHRLLPLSHTFSSILSNRLFKNLLLCRRLPLVGIFKCRLQMILHSAVKHSRFIQCKGRIVHTGDILGRGQMVQVLGQHLELGLCHLLLILLSLLGLCFTKSLQFFLEFFIFVHQSS